MLHQANSTCRHRLPCARSLVPVLLVVAFCTGARAQGDPSSGASAASVCKAMMNDARAERQRSQPAEARRLAGIVLQRCLDLMPESRGEAQGIVQWADQQAQRSAEAAASATPTDAQAPLPEADVPMLSRGSGEGTSMARALATPAAPASTTANGASGVGGSASASSDTGACNAQAEQAVQRGTIFLARATSMTDSHRVTATMARGAIEALRPCAGDPEIAKQIRALERSLQTAMTGCRATASPTSYCDKPAY